MTSFHPNSSYYLSLKVTYPNASDRARAKADGRVNLGGDIMIHGKAVTIMRKGRKPELERSALKWYSDLCREIDSALCGAIR